jgi:hypothetical protein
MLLKREAVKQGTIAVSAQSLRRYTEFDEL